MAFMWCDMKKVLVSVLAILFRSIVNNPAQNIPQLTLSLTFSYFLNFSRHVVHHRQPIPLSQKLVDLSALSMAKILNVDWAFLKHMTKHSQITQSARAQQAPSQRRDRETRLPKVWADGDANNFVSSKNGMMIWASAAK